MGANFKIHHGASPVLQSSWNPNEDREKRVSQRSGKRGVHEGGVLNGGNHGVAGAPFRRIPVGDKRAVQQLGNVSLVQNVP